MGAQRANRAVAARRRALTSRVSTGHVVMVLAGVLGVLLTLSALRAADNTRPVLAATSDIAAGTVVDAHSFRPTRVHVGSDVLATLFDASELAGLRGRVAVERIPAGALRHARGGAPCGRRERSPRDELPDPAQSCRWRCAGRR